MIHNSTVYYHDIFDYPLTSSDLIKWKCGKGITGITGVKSNKGFYFIKGRERLVEQRLQREKISVKKLEIAKGAARILSKIPTVKMVAVTGSLAMMNSPEESDIDLMIITRQGTLWLSRLVILVILSVLDIPVRRSGDQRQSDKLCLNMWLDEIDLVWNKSDRNVYTAHEIAQIVPILNKDRTYEKFIFSNKWILYFWPNAVHISEERSAKSEKVSHPSIIEKLAFKFQYQHMKLKMTREIVTRTRALFHPHDWGKEVLNKLGS